VWIFGPLPKKDYSISKGTLAGSEENNNMPPGINGSAGQISTIESPKPGRSLLVRLLLYVGCIAGAAGLFVAYEHFNMNGQSSLSIATLVAAALLVLVPVRALLGEIFAVERKALHLFHGIGGLALIALPLSGLVSGGPMLERAAMAPFAIMGAAQAMMHQPRNGRQAEALRRFVTSLPEVQQFTQPGDFASPANVSRAVTVLNDLLTKAQALGQTELDSDPNFQSALKAATVRTGLGLSLDAIDHSLNVMGKSPLGASAVPALRGRLEQVRKTLNHPAAKAV
jgi:hypothetical protein